ncbi:MAG: hypothetical protein DMF61_25370 [Blastocatellia bacterium AA13]|nr:MAG: hypothetical protein DMF61_25370 [Blastocatellia bacterium AA13]
MEFRYSAKTLLCDGYLSRLHREFHLVYAFIENFTLYTALYMAPSCACVDEPGSLIIARRDQDLN